MASTGQRTREGEVARVVLEIERRRGAVVLERGADRAGQGKGAQVFLDQGLFDRVGTEGQRAEHVAQEGFGRGGDHQLGQVGRLEEEPVPVGGRQMTLGSREHGVRRHDVEHAQAGDGVRVVQRLAVPHSPTAIVADERIGGVAERQHQLVHVARHGVLVVAVARLVAVAADPQVDPDSVRLDIVALESGHEVHVLFLMFHCSGDDVRMASRRPRCGS